jgi:arylsulfatase A-like enzyme
MFKILPILILPIFLTACADDAPEPATPGGGVATADVEDKAPFKRPPHVVFFLIDTLRADRLSSYGYDRPVSPVVDAVAKEGARFANATAQSSWTMPSTASLFLGRHLRGEIAGVPKESPSIPREFKRGGYVTAGFVVNPLISNPENGFGTWFDSYLAEGNVGQIASWINDHKDQETFTYIHWVDPHAPYAPNKVWHNYVGTEPNIPASEREYYKQVRLEAGLEIDEQVIKKFERDWNGYDDDVASFDRRFNSLIRALRQMEILEDTLIVITADHGEALWDHKEFIVREGMDQPKTVSDVLMVGHGNQLYQELVHTPIIFYGPGVPSGVVIDGPVQNIDVFPTLLELCDLALPEGLTGRSLVPQMIDPNSVTDGFGFSVTRFVSSLQTADGFKLIVPTPAGEEIGLETELYDLKTDPVERNNIAKNHPEIVAASLAKITELLETGLESDWKKFDNSEANQAAMEALGYLEGSEAVPLGVEAEENQ